MEQKHYRDIEVWLSAYISYSPNIELSATAQQNMKNNEIYLTEIHELFETGRVIWADRDHAGCLFTLIGRNCDEREITILGRFESATSLVAVDEINTTE